MQNITGMVERVGKNIKLSLRSNTIQLNHLAGSDSHVQKIFVENAPLTRSGNMKIFLTVFTSFLFSFRDNKLTTIITVSLMNKLDWFRLLTCVMAAYQTISSGWTRRCSNLSSLSRKKGGAYMEAEVFRRFTGIKGCFPSNHSPFLISEAR